MIYFKLTVIAVVALGLLIYTLCFDRKYFFPLLVIEVMCTGFVSFYIFYYIGSYSNSKDDVFLNPRLQSHGSGQYTLKIDVNWKRKPEIFGLNGEDDALVVRYNPKYLSAECADRYYKETETGKSAFELPEEFQYSTMSKNEKEVCLSTIDGEDTDVSIEFKELQPGGSISIYFIHDYKRPLESPIYWEKNDVIELK